jgi:hypothetical protein
MQSAILAYHSFETSQFKLDALYVVRPIKHGFVNLANTPNGLLINLLSFAMSLVA